MDNLTYQQNFYRRVIAHIALECLHYQLHFVLTYQVLHNFPFQHIYYVYIFLPEYGKDDSCYAKQIHVFRVFLYHRQKSLNQKKMKLYSRKLVLRSLMMKLNLLQKQNLNLIQKQKFSLCQ